MLAAALIKYEKKRLVARRIQTSKSKNSIQSLALDKFLAAVESKQLVLAEVCCPVCSEDEYELVSNFDRIGLPVETVRCLSCPTLYSRRRMTAESLTYFYAEMYRELYGGMESPTIAWFEQQVANGRRIAELLHTCQLTSTTSTPLRVLDIGTGAGGALIPFMQRGDHILGIDLDEDFLNFGRKFGLNLQRGGVETLYNLGKFDLIILKDVLEHLPDPRGALLKVSECLSDDGLLFVQVPGLQALGYLGYRYDLCRYLQIAHVCHYTTESLSFLGESVGLSVRHASRQGIVIFSRSKVVPHRLEKAKPSSQIAADALQSIYLRRIPYSIREGVTKPMPESFKKFLRKCRSALSR